LCSGNDLQMKVLVTGSSGLIGSALVDFLEAEGHEVIRLVRQESGLTSKGVLWDPAHGEVDVAKLEGFDAVVHLAGENIGAKRWTAARKVAIRASRVQSTRLLSESLAKLKQKPRVLVSASATGYYGDRGEEVLDEKSEAGAGFLANLCLEWEDATRPAAQAGIRVVNLRFGLVLSATGSALARMLPLFRLGLGGRLGNGQQYMSWVELGDAIRAIHHCLTCESLVGPVNVVSPNPVTNRQFTKILGSVLKRPTLLAVPRVLLRLTLGEIAADLLASARVQPDRLIDTGFVFQHAELEEVFRQVLRESG
jgi:uncharacterized protein (TIGR01777 family)